MKLRITVYNNFEISLVEFMPNITTDHATTYTNTGQTGRFIVCSSIAFLCVSSSDDPPQRTAVKQTSRFTVWINGQMVRYIQKWQISFGQRRLYHYIQISAIYYEKPETAIKDEFKRLNQRLLGASSWMN